MRRILVFASALLVLMTGLGALPTQAQTRDVEGQATEPDLPECTEECLLMATSGNDEEELADLEAVASAAACEYEPVKREHAEEGPVDGYKVSCADTVQIPGSPQTQTHGGCYVPSPGSATRYTKIWITVYYDDYWDSDNAHQIADSAIKYLWAKTDGGSYAHGTQVRIEWCFNYLLAVPSSSYYGLDGDIGNEHEMRNLQHYESRFADAAQLTLVVGDGKVKCTLQCPSADGRYGLVGPGSSADLTQPDDLPVVFVCFLCDPDLAGKRLFVHEAGHAIGLPHTPCDSGYSPTNHRWLHFMAWSKDASSTCWDAYPYNPASGVDHTHWQFKYNDVIDLHDLAYEWCRGYNGGTC